MPKLPRRTTEIYHVDFKRKELIRKRTILKAEIDYAKHDKDLEKLFLSKPKEKIKLGLWAIEVERFVASLSEKYKKDKLNTLLKLVKDALSVIPNFYSYKDLLEIHLQGLEKLKRESE